MYDATIIGAGPAGCIAAILLARGGRNVCLIEQHRFPRDKVCGECLSALGYQTLGRLGLSDAFHRLSPVRLTRARIHPAAARSSQIALPEPMWGISRRRLDHWLLDTARDAGARILQPARCEQLRPKVRVRDLITNDLHDLKARWVLLADGKQALLDPKPRATRDLGIKAHFHDITGPRDSIELFGVNGHYGGIAPIEEDRWNLAFSVPRSRVQSARGEIDAMFDQIIRENRALTERFRGARRDGEWITSALPRFAVSNTWPDRVILLGNAACSIEPVGGEGMGLAMRSAELAAEMLLSDQVDIRRLQSAFRKLWRDGRLGCRAVGRIVSNPALSRWISPSLRTKPIARAAISLLGK